REARRRQLAEVVAGAAGARSQGDAEIGGAAGRARGEGGVVAVQVNGRLGLRDRVAARSQVREAVGAVTAGRGGQADGVAEVVGAGQGHGDAAEAGFARVLGTVVVRGAVDKARQARRRQLAEVVGRAAGARSQGDA